MSQTPTMASRLWLALAILVGATGAVTAVAVLFAPEFADVGRICGTALVVIVFGLLSLGGLGLLRRRATQGWPRILDLILGVGSVISGAYTALWTIALIWDLPGIDFELEWSASLAFATLPLAVGLVIRLLGRESLTGPNGKRLGLIGATCAAYSAVTTMVAPSGLVWVLGTFAIAAVVAAVGILIALPIMAAKRVSSNWTDRTRALLVGKKGLDRLAIQALLIGAIVWRVVLRAITASVLSIAALFIIIIVAPFAVIYLWDAITAALGIVPPVIWDVSGKICMTAGVGLVFGLGLALGQRLWIAGRRNRSVFDLGLSALTILAAAAALVLCIGLVWELWSWPDPFDDETGNTVWELAWGLADVAILFLFATAIRIWSRRRETAVSLAGLVGAGALSATAVVVYVATAMGDDAFDGESVLARVLVALLVVAATALTAGALTQAARRGGAP